MSDDLLRYANNIVDFAQEQFVVPGEGGPELIRLQPHQAAILGHALTPLSDGRFLYETLLYSCVKKSGKTTIAAIVALWMALREYRAEVYCLANDFDQSQSRVFAAVLFAVEHNPRLRSGASITQRRITLLSTGSFIEAEPSEYTGAAGANPSCVVFDELWGYTSDRAQRLYDEMTLPPTRKSPLRVIVTYAGFEGESDLLWTLYQRGMAGTPVSELDSLPCKAAGKLFCYWDHEPRMPWQTPDYYESQRADLRPNAFLRLHRNEWTTGTESFVDLATWDLCVSENHRPLIAQRDLAITVGLDLGIKHDSSACVACAYDGSVPARNRVLLVTHKVWQPHFGSPVDLEHVADYLRELCGRFRVTAVYYDPWQGLGMAQQLTREGIPMLEYPQTLDRLTRLGSNLLELVRGHNLVLYPDAGMRKAASQAVAIESSRGWRISKEKSAHKIDVIVALGMAALGCIEQEGRGHGYEVQDYASFSLGAQEAEREVLTPGVTLDAQDLEDVRRRMAERAARPTLGQLIEQRFGRRN
jgi:phage terminase large subunit-like protein